MEIFSKPVMNVALELEGQTGIMPFQFVQTVDKNLLRKKMLVNWTFGTVNEETREIKYDSELGEIKHFMLQHFDTKKDMMARVFQDGDIKQKIIDTLHRAEDGQPILFIWEKGIADETVFYEALNLIKDGKVSNPMHPIMLSDTGFEVKAPFRALTPDEMSAKS
jgi:hypothetical protein